MRITRCKCFRLSEVNDHNSRIGEDSCWNSQTQSESFLPEVAVFVRALPAREVARHLPRALPGGIHRFAAFARPLAARAVPFSCNRATLPRAQPARSLGE